jgi:hypothetical protein
MNILTLNAEVRQSTFFRLVDVPQSASYFGVLSPSLLIFSFPDDRRVAVLRRFDVSKVEDALDVPDFLAQLLVALVY